MIPPLDVHARPRSVVATARRLKAWQWGLLAESLLVLALASGAIRVLPFRSIVAHASRAPRSRRARTPATVRDLVWSVEAIARRVPWRTVCFQKGLALHAMMQRRGIASRLHYGIGKRAGGALAAHVWIAVDDTVVMGGDVAPEFHCVAVYPAAD